MIDCLAVYEADFTNILFLCYHGSMQGNKGMWGNTEIGVVTHGRIRMCYLYFTYTPERANEVLVLEFTPHILSTKYPSST